jgi:hypothetical protein
VEGGGVSTREGLRNSWVRMMEPRREGGGGVGSGGTAANVAWVLWLDAKTSCA